MATFRVTAPDGTKFKVTAPDDATPDQVQSFAEQQFASMSKPSSWGGETRGVKPPPVQQPAPVSQPAPKGPEVSGLQRAFGNFGAGLVRGAGSIGATLLYPIDKATDLIQGDRGPSMSGMITGQQPLSRNEERRRDITEGLRSLGYDPESFAFGAGKLGGEIAGTAGAGNAIAGLVSRVPGAVAAAPGLLQSIRTAGMATGAAPATLGAKAADLGIRAAGGAITGGASAGLVSPEDATTGAAVGAALPGALQVAGKAGQAVGRVLRGPEQTPEMAAAVKAAREAGYVIPPTQAKASLGNRLMEGMAGKLTTAQNASAANQAVTNKAAATALGLPADTKITPELLDNVRKTAGQAYEAIGSTGTVQPGPQYMKALDDIVTPHLRALAGFPNAKPSPVITMVDSLRTDAFDAASAVAKIRELRTAADDAFRTGNTDIGRASKSAAKALEDALEEHAKGLGNPDLLKGYRDARQLIAKTYSVEKALNPASGTVDARALATQLQKGKPLSGELKKAAEFAAQFKTAAKPPEMMGSLPQFSPLDVYAGGGIAGLGAMTGNPLGALGLALPLARVGARKAALSPMVQNRLVQGQAMQTPNSLRELIYRSAPVLAADR